MDDGLEAPRQGNYGLHLFLAETRPASLQAAGATMATDDSTALAIPGQVILVFHVEMAVDGNS